MKGISHFTSAVAAATFIPGVVALAGHERSLILVLAGIFGLLPDWLDSKIARYFEPADEQIEPQALNFDFEFRRAGDEVEISLLSWQQRWSHSLILAAVFGLAAGGLFGEIAGWVVGVAFATHVLADQLGPLGSNLWWPFTQRRSAGLKWMHSGDPLLNFVTVLVAGGLILYNLNRFAPTLFYDNNIFLLWAVLLPASVGLIFYAAGQQRRRAQPTETLSEVQETDVE